MSWVTARGGRLATLGEGGYSNFHCLTSSIVRPHGFNTIKYRAVNRTIITRALDSAIQAISVYGKASEGIFLVKVFLFFPRFNNLDLKDLSLLSLGHSPL